MKIAVSTIARSADEETFVAETLHGLGAPGVELGPARVFANPAATSNNNAQFCIEPLVELKYVSHS